MELTNEIITAFNNAPSVSNINLLPIHNEHWQKLFEYYNANNKPLHMRCRACYHKVKHFIQLQINTSKANAEQ